VKYQRILAMAGIVGISLLLAFPLRSAVFNTIIVPLAYVFWLLGLVYHAVHQTIWWAVVLVLILYFLLRSLSLKFKFGRRSRADEGPIHGQVETLAGWIKKTERGMYFKWLFANRLGKVAHQILVIRSTGERRSFFDPLTGPDWRPDPPVQSYLESGLQSSFADYPRKRRFFSPPLKTPLDHDLIEIVGYLESQVENK